MIESLMTLQFDNRSCIWVLSLVAFITAVMPIMFTQNMTRSTLFIGVAGLICLAFLDFISQGQVTVQTSILKPKPAYFLALADNSGSESTSTSERDPKTNKLITRGDINQKSLAKFLAQRQFDRIGYTTFDDVPSIKLALKDGTAISAAEAVNADLAPGGGTDFEKAVSSAIHQFETDSPADADRILLVQTDGESEIKATAAGKLVVALRNLHVKVYWVRAVESQEAITYTEPGITDFRNLVEMAGGKRFDVYSHDTADLAFAQVERDNPVNMAPTTVNVNVSAVGLITLVAVPTFTGYYLFMWIFFTRRNRLRITEETTAQV